MTNPLDKLYNAITKRRNGKEALIEWYAREGAWELWNVLFNHADLIADVIRAADFITNYFPKTTSQYAEETDLLNAVDALKAALSKETP